MKKGQEKVAACPGKVTCIGQVDLPASVEGILSCGPKFCTEPVETPVGMLTIVRKVADRVDADNKERCIAEGVDCLSSREGSVRVPNSVKRATEFLRSNNLSLLLADKEGGFAFMPKTVYESKATEAVAKNFVKFDSVRRQK
ncbi:hypothetical protein HPB48_023143 [Haemaphysalis longicornis]|uniref:Uncharacterized protein n=1 Tax=Haemaphysalis longicornis TaxID=44386 RepID=A0A9J6GSJ6_HAELO|nr:hypothetical protein HPB48_023143 [Haemaphysalis longicornis]